MRDRAPAVELVLRVEREVDADVLAPVARRGFAGPGAGDHERRAGHGSRRQTLEHADVGRMARPEIVRVDDDQLGVGGIAEPLRQGGLSHRCLLLRIRPRPGPGRPTRSRPGTPPSSPPGRDSRGRGCAPRASRRCGRRSPPPWRRGRLWASARWTGGCRGRRVATSATGTPMTGRGVTEANMPGRWAAPPAPAMTTLTPRPAASCPKASISRGVRWAETTRTSWGTSKRSSISTAPCMTGRSDELPITTATSGAALTRAPRVRRARAGRACRALAPRTRHGRAPTQRRRRTRSRAPVCAPVVGLCHTGARARPRPPARGRAAPTGRRPRGRRTR